MITMILRKHKFKHLPKVSKKRSVLHREATLESLESMAAGEDDDDIDGWVDEMAALSQPERELAQRAIRPMQLVLIKVRVVVIVDRIYITHLIRSYDVYPSR